MKPSCGLRVFHLTYPSALMQVKSPSLPVRKLKIIKDLIKSLSLASILQISVNDQVVTLNSKKLSHRSPTNPSFFALRHTKLHTTKSKSSQINSNQNPALLTACMAPPPPILSDRSLNQSPPSSTSSRQLLERRS